MSYFLIVETDRLPRVFSFKNFTKLSWQILNAFLVSIVYFFEKGKNNFEVFNFINNHPTQSRRQCEGFEDPEQYQRGQTLR